MKLYNRNEFSRLNEADASKKDVSATEDPKVNEALEKSLREYSKVTKELEDLQKSIEDKVKSLSDEQTKLFGNIYEEMKKSQKNILIVDKIVAEIKIVKGTSGKKNPKYKEAFTAALGKVNDATKKVLEAVLEANTTTTPGKSESDQLNIKITEGILADTWVKFKELVNSIYNKIKSAVSGQTEAVEDLQKLVA